MAATIKLAPGATETDIKKALASLTAGGTLVLPKDQTIAISTGISIDVSKRDITLDLNGSTLVKAGNVTVLSATGGHDAPVSVRLGEDATHHTTLTYSKLPTGLTVGSWVKILSDDYLPNDMRDANTARMGQAMQVAGIKGNVVTFKGELVDQDHYRTNVRATTYKSGDLTIKNGDIVGDQKHPTWNSPLVQLRSLVDGHIQDLHVRNGVGRGINVVDGVNNTITDVSVKNMADGGSAALGIGVSSLSSTGTRVKGYYAEHVTHAADDNAIGVKPNSPYVVQYGGDIGMHVENAVAYQTRNFAFSWHSEAVNGSFKNVMAFDSHGFMTGRGVGGSMINSGGANNERGIMLYEYGTDDSRYINIDNVTLKETGNYSVFSSNQPLYNSIKNSYLESYTNTNLAAPGAVTVTNTKFIKIPRSAVNDVMTGTAKPDLLLGGKGVDKVAGGVGNDYIWGGAGADTLAGGAGRDRFAFHSLAEGGDTITDFQAGRSGDVIDLSVLMAKYHWKDGDPVANGYVRFVQSGTGTKVMVDAAKTGAFTCVATLTNVKATTLSGANLRVTLSADETTGAAAPPLAPGAARGQVVGGDADDHLQGDNSTFYMEGNGGNDTVTASADSNIATRLEGGDGNDTLHGGAGNDALHGGAGNDVTIGGDGNDTHYLESISDVVVESIGEGWDKIVTGIQLTGPVAANVEAITLTGAANLNATANDLGNVMTGNEGKNALTGGAGDDMLLGEAGDDRLNGGLGNDIIDGGVGNDRMAGGMGDDVYLVDSASDVVTEYATAGFDRIVTGIQLTGPLAANIEAMTLNGGAAVSATGNEADNVLVGNDAANTLSGGAGNDRLIGGEGNDRLLGGDGNDLLEGGAGADMISGGTGYDTVSYDASATSLMLDLGNSAANSGDAAGDTFFSIENVRGGSAADTLIGNGTANLLDGGAGDDKLHGLGGNDTIYGGSGADWLEGGAGRDTLQGGGDKDTFYIASLADAGDVITDFHPGEDKIALSSAGFGVASIADIAFVSGAGVVASTGKSTLIYNTDSGQLLWDADGSGADKAQLIATLTDAPQLTQQDIVVS